MTAEGKLPSAAFLLAGLVLLVVLILIVVRIVGLVVVLLVVLIFVLFVHYEFLQVLIGLPQGSITQMSGFILRAEEQAGN